MRITGRTDLNAVKQKGLKKLLCDKVRIAVGFATCGIATGADEIFKTLSKSLVNAKERVSLKKVGCIGYCKEEPIITVRFPGKPILLFPRVSPEKAAKLAEGVLAGKISPEGALCRIDSWDHVITKISYGDGFGEIPRYEDIPFFKYQRKLILRNAGIIDPEDIEEYIAVGGYSALIKALTEMTPSEIIDEVKKSGLRGRGGAGFPTGLKWEITAQEKVETKYLICNADEGDPGAYMNRNEMESDPHSLIEGMIIGGYAIGAREGIIYIRAEYPLAVKRIEKALEEARKYGFLGERILNTSFSFDIRIVKGAGAFVCGEETALIASIEGETGRPRPRPPFPAEKGLWGKPTCINNVETWCNIPLIIAKGGDWFSQIGTSGNSGTKVFSLVGEVDRVGLVEVPLGTTLRTIIFDIGNGSPEGTKVKAVQIGGPSGGCVPAKLFDTPVDYESLKSAGSIMGSGGMVVMSEKTSMVETARYFLTFTSDESCGKCTPCREGLKHMLNILERIIAGRGTREDIKTLEELALTIKATSLCGLGQTAPNPVLTTLRYFREEYERKIKR
ncbi:MAG: SLBB domain-containing protein [Synergistetes bacterium]|nr:SLBB domain-containing protein [Synergistota bacterium]